MNEATLIGSWQEKVEYVDDGPTHVVLSDAEGYRAVLVGLKSGLSVPPHAAASASYHVLEGEGVMVAGSDRFDLIPGATVVVPAGISRGMEAKSNLAVLASHGSPAQKAQMPFKQMAIIGAGSMTAMVVLMIVFGRMFGGLSPMAAMMFPNGGDLGLGLWGMMIVPAVGLLLMFGVMFLSFRSIKKAMSGGAAAHHHS